MGKERLKQSKHTQFYTWDFSLQYLHLHVRREETLMIRLMKERHAKKHIKIKNQEHPINIQVSNHQINPNKLSRTAKETKQNPNPRRKTAAKISRKEAYRKLN